MDKREYQRNYMRMRRLEDPSYGQRAHIHRDRCNWVPKYPTLIREPKPTPTAVIGYLDIETDGISKSEYSSLISWVLTIVFPDGRRETFEDHITEDDVRLEQDRKLKPGEYAHIMTDVRILNSLSKTLEPVQVLKTWYGKGFDVPRVKSRCGFFGIPFPLYWQVVHDDIYFETRKKDYTRNRLAYVAKLHGSPYEATEVTPFHWNLASMGKSEGMKYLLEHNRIDVLNLEFMDKKFGSRPFVRSRI